MKLLRASATLAVAAIVLVFGTIIGFRMLLASPGAAEEAEEFCTDRTVAAGEPLTSNLVTVNVLNSSQRSGLANRVSIDLQTRGFLGGTIGNSTSAIEPEIAAVLSDDPTDPRVKLVAQQFGKGVEIVPTDIPLGEGITVIIGNKYKSIAEKAATSIETDRPITVCIYEVDIPAA